MDYGNITHILVLPKITSVINPQPIRRKKEVHASFGLLGAQKVSHVLFRPMSLHFVVTMRLSSFLWAGFASPVRYDTRQDDIKILEKLRHNADN